MQFKIASASVLATVAGAYFAITSVTAHPESPGEFGPVRRLYVFVFRIGIFWVALYG